MWQALRYTTTLHNNEGQPVGWSTKQDTQHGRSSNCWVSLRSTQPTMLPPGMMPGVQLLQPFARDMGVNLRGRNVGVPQQ